MTTFILGVLLAASVALNAMFIRYTVKLEGRLEEEQDTSADLLERIVETNRHIELRIGEGVVNALCDRRKTLREQRSPAARKGWETRRKKFPGAAAPKEIGSGSGTSPGGREGDLAEPHGAL